MHALWSNTELEELSTLVAELTQLKDELARDREFLSEEADRWGRNVTPHLIERAHADSVEGFIRSHLEQFDRLQRRARNLRTQQLTTLGRLVNDCQRLVTQIRNCELVRLPSNADLAKNPFAA